MIKLIELMKRKEGMTHEEFMDYWVNKHGPLVRDQIPGVRRYVQNHYLQLSSKGGEAPFDGIAEVWYDSVEAFRETAKWYRSTDLVRNDELKFLDLPKCLHYLCEEKVIREK